MLSIHGLTSVDQAKSYYEKDGDYYTQDGAKSYSEFGGKGAETLGIAGKSVDSQLFENLLKGTINKETQLGRPDGEGGIKHKPGWDFTFSAPKSVSTMALVKDGDERLIEVHELANKEAMSFLEKNYVRSRETISGKTSEITTDNLIYASFRHETSRALDPQLHTHNVIMNGTITENGEWRSIESKKLYEAKMLSGLVYRSSLAKMVKALGYEIEITDRKKGFFEIKAVPEYVRDAQSKRRKEIKEAAKERGITSQKGFEKANVMTRSSKKKADREELREYWKSEVSSLGFEPNEIIEHAKANQESKNHDKTSPEKEIEDNIRFAYRSLATNEALFNEEELLKKVLSLGEGYEVDEIKSGISDLVNKEELIVQSKSNNFRTFTTPHAIKVEQDIVHKMMVQQHKHLPALSDKAIQEKINKVRENSDRGGFTKGQEAGFRHIFKTKDGISGIQGLPGVGKTFLLRSAREIAEENKINIIGFAPTGSAAETMFTDSGIPAKTVDGFIFEAQRQLNKGKPIHDPGAIWVMDESSLANAENVNKLFDIARKAEAKLVLLGDKKQLGAVEWGKPFSMLQAFGMRTEEVNDIVRQKEGTPLREAILEASRGEFGKSLNTLGDSVVESDNPLDNLISDVEKYSEKELKETLIIIPKNAERSIVMEQSRKRRQELGLVEKAANQQHGFIAHRNANLNKVELTDARSYEAGQIVEFQQDVPQYEIKAGSFFRVTKYLLTDEGDSRIKLFNKETNRTITIDPGNLVSDHHDSKLMVGVYQEQDITLAKGDEIRWTKSRKDLGLLNGDSGVITEINENIAKIDFGEGKLKELDLTKHKDFDYNYAVTAFTSQGKTYKQSAMLADSNDDFLVNQQSFFVGISRAEKRALVYTDQRKALAKNLDENTGEKTSTMIPALHRNRLLQQSKRKEAERHEKLTAQAYTDVKLISSILSEKNAVFSHEMLLNQTLKYGLGDYDFKHVESAISELRHNNEISLSSIKLANDKEKKFYTAGNHYKHEAKLARLYSEGKDSKKQLVPSGYADAYLDNFNARSKDNGQLVLSDKDIKAMKQLIRSKHEITTILGSETSGHKELMQQVGLKMMMNRNSKVRSLVMSGQQKDKHDSLGLFKVNYIDNWMKSLAIGASNGEKINCSKEVWYIEDATKLTTEQLSEVVTGARLTGARLVLSGNMNEKTMKSGSGFEVLQSQGANTINLLTSKQNANQNLNDASQKLTEGRVNEAVEHLSSNIIEVTADNARDALNLRIEAMVNTYMNLSDKEKTSTGIIIPEKFSRDMLTEALRNRLRAEGKIDTTDHRTTTLKDAFLSPSEKSQSRFYQKNHVIEFESERKKDGIAQKEKFNVVGVDAVKNQLKLQSQQDERVISWNPEETGHTRGRSTKVYKTESLQVAVGDQIKFGSGNKGVRNNEAGTVISIDNGIMKVETGKGVIDVNLSKQNKISHGYASSHFAFKHDTKSNIMVMMNSKNEHLTTKDNLLSTLSRTDNNFLLFTDSKNDIKETLAQSSSIKQSAIADRGVKVAATTPHMDKHGLLLPTFVKIRTELETAAKKAIQTIEAQKNILKPTKQKSL